MLRRIQQGRSDPYDGKLYRTTLDAYVVALDIKTGKEIWNSKVAEWKDGYSMTVAPVIANGVLMTGISGAEYGIRGFIDGWDPQNRKSLVASLHDPGARRTGQRDLAAGQRLLGDTAAARAGSPARTIRISI